MKTNVNENKGWFSSLFGGSNTGKKADPKAAQATAKQLDEFDKVLGGLIEKTVESQVVNKALEHLQNSVNKELKTLIKDLPLEYNLETNELVTKGRTAKTTVEVQEGENKVQKEIVAKVPPTNLLSYRRVQEKELELKIDDDPSKPKSFKKPELGVVEYSKVFKENIDEIDALKSNFVDNCQKLKEIQARKGKFSDSINKNEIVLANRRLYANIVKGVLALALVATTVALAAYMTPDVAQSIGAEIGLDLGNISELAMTTGIASGATGALLGGGLAVMAWIKPASFIIKDLDAKTKTVMGKLKNKSGNLLSDKALEKAIGELSVEDLDTLKQHFSKNEKDIKSSIIKGKEAVESKVSALAQKVASEVNLR